MIFEDFSPLAEKQLQILDEKGNIINAALEPKLSKKQLLKMYKIMHLARTADLKAVQFQRQGRMLTFPPNIGQEATQIGAMAALEESDWLAPAYRELGAMLYRGIPLSNIYLYWYGNEWGMHLKRDYHVLPVNIIIGSQVNHAAGLAYASKILNKKEVVLATIGDGGTSQGMFYEGLNFASVLEAPLVVLIQNNQYAISTPLKKQTKTKQLAQKAVAFGIPGLQVDGNDILAVYVAILEAAKHARAGNGPVLIEALTYRLGAHTTSDNPKIYREESEEKTWQAKEPMIRFKQYLINKKYWSQKDEEALDAEHNELINEVIKEIEEKTGQVELEDIFKYTYQTKTPQLSEQYEYAKTFLDKEEN